MPLSGIFRPADFISYIVLFQYLSTQVEKQFKEKHKKYFFFMIQPKDII